MNNLNEIYELEFNKIEAIDGLHKLFFQENSEFIKSSFSFIFSINYIKNRAETRSYFGTKYNTTFSLLLESIYALLSGQSRSALLLLRAAQESNFRFVLEKERDLMKEINPSLEFDSLDYRFIETKKKFTKDLKLFLDESKYSEYFITIERNLTLYKNLSGVAHSGSEKEPVISVEFFSHLYEDTLINRNDFFNLFNEVLNNIFLLNFFLVRESLKQWDTFLLNDFLNIPYGKKRAATLRNIIKN